MSDMTRSGHQQFLEAAERKYQTYVRQRMDRIATCEICDFEVMPGEKRWNSRTVVAHLDCVIDYSEYLDEEHADGR